MDNQTNGDASKTSTTAGVPKTSAVETSNTSTVKTSKTSTVGGNTIIGGTLRPESLTSMLQLFITISVIMFVVTQFFGAYNGMLSSYIWLMIGLITTIILGFHYTYGKDKNNRFIKKRSIGDAINNFLPNFGCAFPLLVIIYVLIKIRPILSNKNVILPEEFYWLNNLTFFFILLIFFLTGKFYNAVGHERDAYGKKLHSSSRWLGGILITSILAAFTSIRLYVITSAYITDG